MNKLILAEARANHAFYGMLVFAMLFALLSRAGATNAEWVAFIFTGITTTIWEISRKFSHGIAPDPIDVLYGISLPTVCMVLEVA